MALWLSIEELPPLAIKLCLVGTPDQATSMTENEADLNLHRAIDKYPEYRWEPVARRGSFVLQGTARPRRYSAG